MVGFIPVLQFLGLLSFIRAQVCDKNFLIKVENLLERLEEATEINKQLNDTITELNARNARQDAVIEQMNSTLSMMQTGKI